MEHLGSMGIPGDRLRTPRADVTYNVLAYRDGEILVLRVAESPHNPPEGTAPLEQLAELRLPRGTLPRVLDVLAAFAEALGAKPEVRTRLSNLESGIPDDFMERWS